MKKYLKKISLLNKLNQYLLQRKLLRKFLFCSREEENHIKFYSQFIKKGDLVFDVGANVGCRTKLFLNLDANVIAFEPQPELCEHLSSYLSVHKNFKLQQTALGEKVGQETIHMCDAHVLSSMSQRWISATKRARFKNYEWNKETIVNVSTLDNQISKHGLPKFIKIDVEGYELEVIKGLSQKVPFISIEFTAEDIQNSFRCIDTLKNLGSFKSSYSYAEELSLNSPWMNPDDLVKKLSNICDKNPQCWGDIYIRF